MQDLGKGKRTGSTYERLGSECLRKINPFFRSRIVLKLDLVLAIYEAPPLNGTKAECFSTNLLDDLADAVINLTSKPE